LIALLSIALASPPSEAEPVADEPVVLSEEAARIPEPRGVEWHPYTPQGTPLDTQAFYRAVGRTDLAKQQRRRQRTRVLGCMGLIGASAVGGALTSAFLLPELVDDGSLVALGAAGGLWAAAHAPAVFVVPLLITGSRKRQFPALTISRSEAESLVSEPRP